MWFDHVIESLLREGALVVASSIILAGPVQFIGEGSMGGGGGGGGPGFLQCFATGSTIPWTGPGFWTGLDSGLDS